MSQCLRKVEDVLLADSQLMLNLGFKRFMDAPVRHHTMDRVDGVMQWVDEYRLVV
jgi:hypothetical protein